MLFLFVRVSLPGRSVSQLERIGFFVVDKDSTPERLVLNRTVTLKEATGKSSVPKDKSREGAAGEDGDMLMGSVFFFRARRRKMPQN